MDGDRRRSCLPSRRSLHVMGSLMKFRVYWGIRWWWALPVFLSAPLISQTLTSAFPLQIFFNVLWDVGLAVGVPRLWDWGHPLYLGIHEEGLTVGSVPYSVGDLESIYISNRAIMLRHNKRRWVRLNLVATRADRDRLPELVVWAQNQGVPAAIRTFARRQ